MNMKELLPRSRCMQEAAEAKKGLIWILELLIFVVVFIASTFAQMLIMIPKTGLNVRSPNVVFGVLCALPHFGDYYLH